MDLPDMSGLEFQQQVATTHAPVIIVSRLVEIRKSVLCMRAGAIDFLPLPVDASALFGAVEIALDLDRRTRARRLLCATLHQRLSSLTRREREVAALVVRGLMNKHIAAELGISLVTVQIHRGNIMRKMKAQSLADLVHMAHLTGFLADLAEHPSLALGLSAARAQSTVSLLTPHPAT
jgi:FixJ family two-component response regulator